MKARSRSSILKVRVGKIDSALLAMTCFSRIWSRNSRRRNQIFCRSRKVGVQQLSFSFRKDSFCIMQEQIQSQGSHSSDVEAALATAEVALEATDSNFLSPWVGVGFAV